MSQWVAVGVHTMGARKVPVSELIPEVMKALGPFETADAAREAANGVGMDPDLTRWVVVPLAEA